MDYVETLEAERQAYARKWSQANAANFEAAGHYQWMADFVDGKTRVLEIGTGDGRGTMELVRRGHAVVSIDENTACLGLALSRIGEAGVTVTLEQRGKTRTVYRAYEIKYRYPSSQMPSEGQALLLDGDIIGDPKLVQWLMDMGPFDAVVCWLMGSHSARWMNVLFADRRIRDAQMYRLAVQNKVYKLADEILCGSGLLHLVDRGEPHHTDAMRREYIRSHLDQASVTSLQFVRADSHAYQEITGPNSVAMCVVELPSNREADLSQLALKSIVFRKT